MEENNFQFYNSDEEITFNVKCTMKSRWIPQFISFLHYMQSMGEVGHSAIVGFYSDGDGDFRPDFHADLEVAIEYPTWDEERTKRYHPEVVFDAG